MFNGLVKQYYDKYELLGSLDQEQLFYHYVGIRPELGKKYLSPFRQDKTPGCYFKWYSGVLYLVENSGYKGKLYWNVIDCLMELYGCDFRHALGVIASDYKISPSRTRSIERLTTVDRRPQIRFTAKEWRDNIFNLSNDVLRKEFVYLVEDYWIGRDGVFTKNTVHNPKKCLTIAYHFPDTDHVKLYWPEEKENKWYSNCDISDIFGKYKVNYYSTISDKLIITKSQKDRLMLDYHLGYSAIATQNEGSLLPNDFVDHIKQQFNSIYVLYDNDRAGLEASTKICEKYNFTPIVLELDTKDIYDSVQKFGLNNIRTYLNTLV